MAEDSVLEADAWVDRLDRKLRLLSNQPKIGRARDHLSPGVRSMPFGRYVIFYEPLPDGIDIVRVLHSACDTDAVFDRDSDLPAVWRSS